MAGNNPPGPLGWRRFDFFTRGGVPFCVAPAAGVIGSAAAPAWCSRSRRCAVEVLCQRRFLDGFEPKHALGDEVDRIEGFDARAELPGRQIRVYL